MEISELTVRQLQLETARALSSISADNNKLSEFNKMARHNSVVWYQNVLKWYVSEYGGLPSVAGPGMIVRLIYEDL